MFKKINLYTRLFSERMEALLPEEALEDDHKTFDSAVRVLTLRDYDYLDFRNEAFDKVKKCFMLCTMILTMLSFT